jgi:signal transduction histidine kinase/CheY-like chemotaxis protein
MRGASLDSVHRFLGGSFVDPKALAIQEAALSVDASLRDRVELTFPQRAVYQRVVAPVRESLGALLGHIVLYRNVTHEVEVERAKSEFVSVVSHELRTPMTSVKTSLSLLLNGAGGPLEAATRELIEIAHRNAERLIRLVNDLLDLSRLEAGRMDLHIERVALGEAITSSVDAVRGFADEREVAIALVPPPEPIAVQGMRDRVEQVAVNLLANAIKFSRSGGQVRVRWWRDEDGAVVEVADQGPGIPADKLGVIFEPFRQLDSSTTREHGGAGLGLAISQDIVRALGGRLWVESEMGTGSRFFMRLGLAPEQALAVEPGPAPPAAARSTRVLVAHSDSDWRRLATVRAESDGWGVVTAETGAAALACLEREAVDAVVLALELSDVHGLELLQQIYEHPKFFDIPVVIATEVESPVLTKDGTVVATTPQGALDCVRRLLAAPPRAMVLLVEDDPILRMVLARLLRRAGYACLAVSKAQQALEFTRTRTPRAIITDYRMPEMNGVTLLRELRKTPALTGVPAVMLTGHAGPELARQLVEVSARLLTKPVDFAALLALVGQLI